MAHILIAYKQFPAPSVGHAGGESLYGLMAALQRRGHDLTLVARIADEERGHLPEAEAICHRVYTVPHHRSLGGPRPLAFVRSYIMFRRAMREALRVERPDLLHVETTQTALAALGVRRPPASYRTQDANWFLLEQEAARLRGVRRRWTRCRAWCFRRLEAFVCRRYELMVAISERDRQLVAEMCAPSQLLMVPLTPALQPEVEVFPAMADGPNLLFVGAMSRDHNLAGVTWFLDEIWPEIAAAVPEARFYIVGGHPPDDLKARADDRRVFVTGFVDDLASWYRGATIFVSPMLVAGGLLQKVMDALAMGVPVVATSVSNHGVGAPPGESLITADTSEAFAAAVIALLADPAARARIGAAGQAFVAAHYDFEAAVDRWEAALLDLLHDAR